MMKILALLFTFTLVHISLMAQSQQSDSIPWHHNSSKDSDWQGISLNRALQYVEKKNRIANIVIVAVIDSGLDTAHEDIRDRLWHNPGEIPYNNIDDDGNGYIDDIYGWNFIGGSDGRNIEGETLESVRFYRENKKAYAGKSSSEIPKEKKEEYKLWLKAKKEVLAKIKSYNEMIEIYNNWYNAINNAQNILSEPIGSDSLSIEDIKKYSPQNKDENAARNLLIYTDSIGLSKDRAVKVKAHFERELEKKYNLNYNPRPDIIGDDTDDMNDSIYGNNDISAKGLSHGTGVSGIIGAIRNNGIGTQGIVDSVQIMAIRVVPGGDERDKDVALAIRYAVNNGAKIINCSFGKDYSKHPEFVLDAIDYAIAHDVLIIHAAGNSAENNDKVKHYPTPKESQRTHWIDVGASGQKDDLNLAADFTNYGRKTVDVFAPGVNIYSISPKNKYHSTSGTSDSAPVVAGIAAFLKSYYPELSATQLRQIIIESAIVFKKTKVKMPGSSKKTTKFGKLSTSGGVVNVYTAVILAEKLLEEK